MSSNSLFREVVASVLTFSLGVIVAFCTVLLGAMIVARQMANPAFTGILSVLEVGILSLVVPAAGLLLLVTALQGISGIAPRRFCWRHGYSITGIAGLVGIALAILTSAVAWTTTSWLSGLSYLGTNRSLLALPLVTLPIGVVFYLLWHNKPPDPHPVANDDIWDLPKQTRMKQSTGTKPDYPSSVSKAHEQDEQDSLSDTNSSTNPESHSPPEVNLDELEYDWTTETDVSMDDIGGMDDLKEELEKEIIYPFTSGKQKAEELDIPLPNLLLYGPPGTGKTYLAKALATELGLPFVKLSGSDVQSKWINQSPEKINSLFEEAKTVAASEGGAVIFLDELDAVLKRRTGAEGSHDEDNKAVAEFLTHLQDTSEHDILFIGATNRIDALDEAAMRSGRIDKQIHVGKPDREARKAILEVQLSHRSHQLTDEQLEYVATETSGLSAADLESLVIDAARLSAFYRNDDKIVWDDFQRALTEHDS